MIGSIGRIAALLLLGTALACATSEPGSQGESSASSSSGAIGGGGLGGSGGDASMGPEVDETSIRMETDTWSFDPGAPGYQFPLAFIFTHNEGTRDIATISRVEAWFEGGSPQVFEIDEAPEGLEGQAGQTEQWRIRLTLGTAAAAGDTIIGVALNNAGYMISYPSSGVMEPFGVGTLYLVIHGTFTDGGLWVTSGALTQGNP